MLFQVTNDLQVFMLFYVILVASFSNYLSVLGIPLAAENDKVGITMGNLFNTFRMSLGDFDFS